MAITKLRVPRECPSNPMVKKTNRIWHSHTRPVLHLLLTFLLFFFLAFGQETKEEPKIALLHSTHTRTAIPELAEWVNSNLADWETYLLNRRLKYRVVTSKELETDITDYDLLILPSAICLSAREKSAIRMFLSAGGGILATGALGSRNEKNEWQGWTFLSSLFGVEVTGEIELDESASLTLKANSPLSYRIPPGFRLEVTTGERIKPLAVKVMGAKTSPIGYWYDFRTSPDLRATEFEKNCGLISGEYQRGRFVWLGFERGTVVGVKSIQVILDRILSNSISWLRKEPVAWLNPWPCADKEAKAAVVFVCDAEHRYLHALNALRVLNNQGISGTFFLVPEEAVNNPQATKTLAEYGEIGLHGVAVYRWQPYEEQFSRLKEGKELIEGLTGKKVWGFRPPEELYDSSTVKALMDLDYEYLCADDVMDRACPTIISLPSSGEKRLVTFPKAEKDDYELLLKDNLRTADEIFNALKNQFLRIYDVQGAYFLLYHSHLLCTEKNIPALKEFVEFCKSKKVWFATCKEIADWWQGFENLSLTARTRSSSKIEVKVTNGNKFTIENLQLFIAPPKPVKQISIKPQGIKIPEYEIKQAGRVVALKVKNLGPYANQTFLIDYR